MFNTSNGLFRAYQELLLTCDVLALARIRYADSEYMSEAKYDLLQKADSAYLLHILNKLRNAEITSVKLYCQRYEFIDKTTQEGRDMYEHRLLRARIEVVNQRIKKANLIDDQKKLYRRKEELQNQVENTKEKLRKRKRGD